MGQGEVQVTVYINQTGQWKTPDVTSLPSVAVTARLEEPLREIALRALDQADIELDRQWIWLVAPPDDRNRQFMTGIPAVIADDGGLHWILGEAPDRVTLAELQRTSDAGLFAFDPNAICVERLVGANGILPGWEEFFGWLSEHTADAIIGVAVVSLIRRLKQLVPRWQRRGARTPYAFIDVVPVRSQWRLEELAQLLSVDQEEARDLLETLGFVLNADSGYYEASTDPQVGELRRRIIEDYRGGGVNGVNPPQGPDTEADDR
jgi:hypothetical protein